MLAAAMLFPARVLLFHNRAGLFPPSVDKLDEPKRIVYLPLSSSFLVVFFNVSLFTFAAILLTSVETPSHIL